MTAKKGRTARAVYAKVTIATAAALAVQAISRRLRRRTS